VRRTRRAEAMRAAVAVLEMALGKLGYKVDYGAGVAAAQKVLARG